MSSLGKVIRRMCLHMGEKHSLAKKRGKRARAGGDEDAEPDEDSFSSF